MANLNRRQLLVTGGHLLAAHALTACAMRGSEPVIAQPLDAARFSAARQHTRTPFGDIAYVAQGEGRDVLLLHGFPLNGFQWRGAVEKLAPFARCIAPDLLGMGHTRAVPGQDLGPDSQVLMLVSLLNGLGIERVDLIANDSGCAVAQLLAVRHPTRVRSLLLTNGDTEKQCPPAAMLPVIDLARRGRFVDEWLAPWLADPVLARSDRGIGGLCYANRAHPTDEALQMYFAPVIGSPECKDALQRYAVALEHNVLAGIADAQRRSGIPTRIVWGIDDTIFDLSNADYLASLFGNSRGVRRLANAKLFWPEERPELIAAQARILWASADAMA